MNRRGSLYGSANLAHVPSDDTEEKYVRVAGSTILGAEGLFFLPSCTSLPQALKPYWREDPAFSTRISSVQGQNDDSFSRLQAGL